IEMVNKKYAFLAVGLIASIVVGAGVAMAATDTDKMPCGDPTFRQQMLDSHVKQGMVTQEQADLMKKQMDKMMIQQQPPKQ
ncbi:MAG TPA: DUF2680 domain-containing protein, partial [Negativicutes bacterium]|nr:DUF2680 domain-containing protein [Negativicutes bacterium]